MSYKTTLIMALVLAVGIASVLLINKSDEKKEQQQEIEGKLLNIEPDSINYIALFPGGIELNKTNGQWHIEKPVKTNANNSTINSLTEMFDWANIERSISSNPAEYAQFGLQPELGKMIVGHSSGKDTLYLGDKSPTGSFVFARRSASPDVFLTTTSLETNINKTLFDLRDTRVVNFSNNELQKLEIKTGSKFISLVKSGPEWALEKPVEWPALLSSVNEITNRLGSENAKSFVDEEPVSLAKYGLNNPYMTIDLFLGSNMAKKTLKIGDRKGDQYYALDDTRKPVFMVDSAFVNKMNADVFTLRYKKIADYTTDDVNKVELSFDGTEFVCVKDTSDTWHIESENNAVAKAWKVSAIIRAVTSLVIDEFVDDSPVSLGRYGLSNPDVICKLYKDDHLLTELRTGSISGDNQYFKTTDKPSVYLCSKSKFVSMKPTLDELLEEAEPAAVEELP